jgi:transposase
MKMAVAYSHDLRIRALNLIDSGETTISVAQMLKIGRSTLELWKKNRREGKGLRPKENWQNGYGHKITDLEAFKEFVDKNSSLTLKEMAKKWGDVKKMTIQRALKKIKYVKKKDLWIR